MKVFSITEISGYISNVLKNDPFLSNVWVEGEVSNFKKSGSGHVYFSLKDDKALLNCIVFRTMDVARTLQLKNGTKIQARGSLITYNQSSSYQLLVKEIQESGLGQIYQKYLFLKEKYAEKGYFDISHKKTLPKFPRKIGVITSQTGAAIRDIVQNIRRRYPIADIILYPVVVQGENAPAEIRHAVQFMDQREYDVLIVGRGGGSFEDLNAFNDEELLLTIFEANTPIVSAVGHEVDNMLTDFIADVRASTPTAAAELVTPDLQEIFKQFEKVEKDLEIKIHTKFEEEYRMLEYLEKEIEFKNPEIILKRRQEEIQTIFSLLKERYRNNLFDKISQEEHLYQILCRFDVEEKFLKREKELDDLLEKARLLKDYNLTLNNGKLSSLCQRLILLNPKAILQRGYARVYHNNEVVRSIQDVEIETDIQVMLSDGNFQATVNGKERE